MASQETIDAVVRLLKRTPEQDVQVRETPGRQDTQLALSMLHAAGVMDATDEALEAAAKILHAERVGRESRLRAVLRDMGGVYAGHVLNLGKMGSRLHRRRRQIANKTEECRFLIAKLEERDVPREVVIAWLKGFHEARKKAGATK